MNTQTHALMGAALLGAAGDHGLTSMAILGGVLPDLPAILLVVHARWIERLEFREIFGTLYFSRRWQTILAPWHSLPLWLFALATAFRLQSPYLVAFAASGLIHIAIDFFVHVDDAHRHVWPVSNWRFRSPVSYWDRNYFGLVFQPFELMLATTFTALLLLRATETWQSMVIGGILLGYTRRLIAFGAATAAGSSRWW